MHREQQRTLRRSLAALTSVAAMSSLVTSTAGALPPAPVVVSDEFTFRTAWSSIGTTEIQLAADITLTCAGGTTPLRGSSTDVVVDGQGHTLHNTCTSGDHGVLKATGTGAVTIRDITISGGRLASGVGAGVATTSSALTIIDSTLTDNVGPSSGGGAAGDGGPLTVIGSTITGNTAVDPGSAFSSDTSITVSSSTITGNTGLQAIGSSGPITITESTVNANETDGEYAVGGGSTVTVTRSTIAGNSDGAIGAHQVDGINATITGNGADGIRTDGSVSLRYATVAQNGGTNVDAGSADFFATVLADAGTANCAGTASSSGHNFADDSSCGLPAPETHFGVDPKLTALGSYGGPTPTHLPMAGSPLLDAIPTANCQDGAPGVDSDQRRVPRPQRGGCDIGATEVQPVTFSDVPITHPFFTEIDWLVFEDITGGYPDGTFRPANPVTRQSMAAFLYRNAGEPAFTPPTVPTFPDVPLTHPFFAEIEWLASTGITGGYPDGTFRPTTTVTRQSMAAFLYRDAGEPAFTPPTVPTFPDVPLTHPFFAEIEWLASTGITGGYPDGTFRPTTTVTRQSMAAFLYRYDQL